MLNPLIFHDTTISFCGEMFPKLPGEDVPLALLRLACETKLTVLASSREGFASLEVLPEAPMAERITKRTTLHGISSAADAFNAVVMAVDQRKHVMEIGMLINFPPVPATAAIVLPLDYEKRKDRRQGRYYLLRAKDGTYHVIALHLRDEERYWARLHVESLPPGTIEPGQELTGLAKYYKL